METSKKIFLGQARVLFLTIKFSKNVETSDLISSISTQVTITVLKSS